MKEAHDDLIARLPTILYYYVSRNLSLSQATWSLEL